MENKKRHVTLGADPELFVSVQGNVVPVCGLVGGSKGAPIYPYKSMGFPLDRTGILEDNALLELNFPVSPSPDHFFQTLSKIVETISGLGVPTPKGIPSDYISANSAPAPLREPPPLDEWIINNIGVKPTEAQRKKWFLKWQTETMRSGSTMTPVLQIQPGVSSHKFASRHFEKFPELKQIGCDPDFSAYGKRVVPTAESLGDYRHAAGHIHFGIDPWPEGLTKEAFVQFLDLFLACPLAMSDKQGPRRAHYGLAGLYRPKDYGVEYRTLSNKWVWSVTTGGALYNNFHKAITLVSSLFREYDANMHNFVKLYRNLDWDRIQKAINEEDSKTCGGYFWIGVNAMKSADLVQGMVI